LYYIIKYARLTEEKLIETIMDKIEEILARGVEKVYPSREALEKILKSDKKLKLYQGFDPTGSQLHVGHLTGLMKLKQFQQSGHKVIFLIGDVTATIGDPSGKTEGRRVLSRDEVNKYAEKYKEQASRVLDFDGANPVEIKFNSEWWDKMNALEFGKISHYLTYAQVVERDLFQERKKSGQDVFMNEFFYPLLQAYDSVVMDVDLELGGNDQMFNMMMGRKLMRNMKSKEKFVMTLPLLTDSSGKKIGKTEGNVIALDAEPSEFYGMIMSFSDDIIVKGFEQLTDVPMSEVDEIKSKIKVGENPMIFKKKLAYELTRMLNDEERAEKAAMDFDKRFSKGELPENLEVRSVEPGQLLVEIMVSLELAPSKSEARRLIEQGAVKINGEGIDDVNYIYDLSGENILQVGKLRVVKIMSS